MLPTEFTQPMECPLCHQRGVSPWRMLLGGIKTVKLVCNACGKEVCVDHGDYWMLWAALSFVLISPGMGIVDNLILDIAITIPFMVFFIGAQIRYMKLLSPK